MAVDWFGRWLDGHLKRHETAGLPSPESNPEMYAGWRAEFEHAGIAERAATLASMRLLSKAPKPAWHFAALMKLARGDGPRASGREAAEAASRDCRRCEGNGRVPVVSTDGRQTAVAHCDCPYGRLLRDAAAKAIPGRYILTLDDVMKRRVFRDTRTGEPVSYELWSDHGDRRDDRGSDRPGRALPAAARR